MDPVQARRDDLCKPGTDGGMQAGVIFRGQEGALELLSCSSNHV